MQKACIRAPYQKWPKKIPDALTLPHRLYLGVTKLRSQLRMPTPSEYEGPCKAAAPWYRKFRPRPFQPNPMMWQPRQ